MIKIPDVSTRRILTSTAIRPCESASPATLLTSLINLSHSISADHKSKPFTTNKRNLKGCIRLVENLLVFFQELRTGQSELSGSIALSLSELHFIFQKVKYLLEDCTRDDARVWVLIKSEKVSNQLRVLIKAICVALDVLPLDLINVPVEVKEMVGLVMRQALKKNNQGVEAEDKTALNIVHSILGQFEDGIVPESGDVRWVMEYLGIRSWSECNREIKFLESEIGFEYLTTEKRDLGILSSLMGFMSYCRGVLFDAVDRTTIVQFDSGSNNEVIGCLNGDDFRCPISLEVMADPVTIATGHTYDRSSILKWFRSGNHTCPKTGEKVICTDLVPNLAMKRLIKQYCFENGIPFAESSGGRSRDITRTALAGSAAAEGAMKMLANFLVGRLVGGTGREQNKAAFEIRLLTKTSIFNRSCLVEAGAVPSLLNLLCSTDPLAQENTAASLLNLSKYSKGKRVLVENGGLELVINVIERGLKMEARQHAAGMLFYLASVEEYRIMIGEIPQAIPVLMRLINEGTDRGKKNALVAIFGLLMYNDNRWRVLAAGVVPLLVDLLASSEREDLVTDSLAVLATLAEKEDGTMAILRAAAVPTIVGVMSSSTSRTSKEYCVSLLLALCINGGADVVPVLVRNPSLMGPLYSILTEGSSRASKKASSLIRVLQEFNEKKSSGLRSPVLQQERFIHVW